ncbi:hypothetical protein BDY17DRAFT_317332 [Neohortaea acidophila]|uniref:Uncharacterized protein n=1 Tax=Neohortaea acidophila TaxID=245834 RepID=A0A6A6PRP9_9PEZI|nr:uncharacterized protein BDY17DRAFT_317332 [Neohortaea acidophila]KAF2482769.1 hypothetical protein BDY17DRAFT_317332 [Neohortaea acidophila]
MALLRAQPDYLIRQSNKEPEWSSLCNNVLDEYLETDDLFGFRQIDHGRDSSNDSVHLFDFSGSSEQSHHTEATSPMPSWEPLVPNPLQPQAKAPVDFWTKTLNALERNAAECEARTLRTTKSHPDFLSLGGHPSPPFVTLSPTDQSYYSQQRLPRSAANGKRRNITSRSLSRGRPTGVTKGAVAGSANPHASPRKCSASPSKMMDPSRYRSGFRDVWTDKVKASPKKYELRVPSSAVPAPLVSSGRTPYDEDFAALGSDRLYSAYDEHISPLTKSFQQTYIHTPIASPRVNYAAHAHNSYFEPPPLYPASQYGQQSLPLNDTAPLYNGQATLLTTNRIGSFDFGFSTSPDSAVWCTADALQTSSPYTQLHAPMGGLPLGILPTLENNHMANSNGLGISCEPSLVCPPTASMYRHNEFETTYNQQLLHGLPSTPHHRHTRSYDRSESPSPPTTEPRSSKRASGTRRASRHRRTKSTNSTPRHPQHVERSGFVNFTPDDSTKLLSGVAPSGSSKTKAKREKEAAEKRRRLSQAAIRAVVEAGGDVGALSKAGLLL